MPRRTAGDRALRRPATAALPGHAAAAHRAGVAVAPVAEELLTLTAALMPRTEPVLTTARLANGEIGRRPLRRRLALGPRQRGANQRPVNRAFHLLIVARVGVGIGSGIGGRLLGDSELGRLDR